MQILMEIRDPAITALISVCIESVYHDVNAPSNTSGLRATTACCISTDDTYGQEAHLIQLLTQGIILSCEGAAFPGAQQKSGIRVPRLCVSCLQQKKAYMSVLLCYKTVT